MEKLIYLNEFFFDYEKEILNEFKTKYETYELKKDLNNFERYLLIIFKLILSREITDRILDKIIYIKLKKQIKRINKTFEYNFFCIGDHSLSNNHINLIKKEIKIISSIVYLWDDLEKVLKWDSQKKSYKFLKYRYQFDRIYSFDKSDCAKYGFIYRPTFYSKNLEKNKNIKVKNKFDCIFVGQYSAERYLKIEKIKEEIKTNDYIYFFDRIDRFLKNYFKKENIYFKKLAKSEYNKKMFESNVIIDLVNSNQKGVTQRTLDSIYLQKKIITDLKEVQEYSFYNDKNIFVIKDFNSIEAKKLQIFLKQPYETIDKEIVENYSIKNWMNSFNFKKV